MIFHDDAEPNDVATETVATLKSAADQIGKADRRISDERIAELRAAMDRLRNTLDMKERMNADRT